jgi:glycosyltransferase involved in cell wall biosynthesis
MKISVIAPVLNENPWIGYSIMSCLENVHEFVYALDEKSNDGTRELLDFIRHRYAFEKLKVLNHPTFHPSDTKAYNGAFNDCIKAATGDVCWFLHPDMVVTKWNAISSGPLAWFTHLRSFAGDMETEIIRGRMSRWKNIHSKSFGLHYAGAYGSENEDFYHSIITGNVYKHHGPDFDKYPFEVADSGIHVNHYCEVKEYKRRLEKMKLCLRTQHPAFTDSLIDEMATHHPRVTLQPSGSRFGVFEFQKAASTIPEVFSKYKDEFSSFQKELVHNG